jgi:hypothetical protein
VDTREKQHVRRHTEDVTVGCARQTRKRARTDKYESCITTMGKMGKVSVIRHAHDHNLKLLTLFFPVSSELLLSFRHELVE